MNDVVIIPDAGPLFSLAAGDLLGILERFSIQITDVVKEETIDKGHIKGCSVEASRLLEFYTRHVNHIQIVSTQVGALLKASRKTNPQFEQPRDLGELSIQSYLIELHAQKSSIQPVVLFEDHWFFKQRANFPSSCRLISTEAFLRSVEKLGIIQSANKARQAIHMARPSASLLDCDVIHSKN